MPDPEETIRIYGGYSCLSIRYMKVVETMIDKGQTPVHQNIVSGLASQIGVEPIHIHQALLRFWGKDASEVIANCSFA